MRPIQIDSKVRTFYVTMGSFITLHSILMKLYSHSSASNPVLVLNTIF